MYIFFLFYLRYRNYRTFVSPRPVQFSCLAIDSANEFVAAGAQDVFEIYLWCMKIGHLLEVHIDEYYSELIFIIRLMEVFVFLVLARSRRSSCKHCIYTSRI